jgi:hypothetical protein
MRALAWTEIAIGVFFTIGSVSYAGDPLGERVAFSLLYCVMFALGAALSFRVARMGCRIEGEVLRIRNQLKEHVVPWNDMDRFSFGRSANMSRVARVHLRDGRIIKIAGITSTALAPGKSASYNLVIGLQAELDRRRSSSMG